MTAPALIEVNDPFTAVRALNRMRSAGFALSLDADRLLIKPVSHLTEPQRAYIRAHRPALLALLMDAATVYSALAQAGPAGLDWREGTPTDWPNARLLAADEALYGDGRMVTRNDRRYLRECAPVPDFVPDFVPDLYRTVPESAKASCTVPYRGTYKVPGRAVHEAGTDGRGTGNESQPESQPASPPVDADPVAARIAELEALGWSPWNAKAKAEGEARKAGVETRP